MKMARDVALFGAGCCFGAVGLIVIVMIGLFMQEQILTSRPLFVTPVAISTPLVITPLPLVVPMQPVPTIVLAEPTFAPTTIVLPTDIPLPTATSIPTITPFPTAIPIPTATPMPPAATLAPQTGVTYENICDVDESNMTDPQLTAHAAQFAGQTFSGWRGWVYDVVSRADGSYNLEIAMEERGFMWTRDVIVENIPPDLAVRLNVEQLLLFDGRIARVDYAFEVMCNPLTVDSLVLRE